MFPSSGAIALRPSDASPDTPHSCGNDRHAERTKPQAPPLRREVRVEELAFPGLGSQPGDHFVEALALDLDVRTELELGGYRDVPDERGYLFLHGGDLGGQFESRSSTSLL